VILKDPIHIHCLENYLEKGGKVRRWLKVMLDKPTLLSTKESTPKMDGFEQR
jgi:hypothetical protein